ncbi:hypothetical protein U9M48_034987 [Paspalum notatum var. saurae]|uniref:Fe2OG dioxygenase domain-containing protein n=1 Tax=Paspalum notatum var. saurae TaxID=547442 RepID=A0AAQ3X9J0_PASNO
MESTVPTVDFSKLQGTLAERSAAVQDIGRICQNKGFFQLINHGINTGILRDALAAAAAFFDLPMEDMAGLVSDDITQPVRYSTFTELDGGEIKIRRHILKQYSYPLEEWIGKWPEKPWQYRSVPVSSSVRSSSSPATHHSIVERMAKYAAEVRRVVAEIVEAIAESLGLRRDYLRAQMEQGFEMMALNFYPPPPPSRDESFGGGGGTVVCCGEHTDYTLVTVLLASGHGLEELDREAAGSWRPVPHCAGGSLTVHVGNYLEVLSNGRYRAALHRVVMERGRGGGGGGGARVSIASLPSLAMDARVEVAEELVDARHPAAYRGSTLAEFIEFLSAGGNGGDFMENLKISGTEDQQ